MLILFSITAVSAETSNSTTPKLSDNTNNNPVLTQDDTNNEYNPSQEISDKINNANNGDSIVINPGTYKIHNITIKKNINIQGNGNPRDIVLDGEQLSTIFFIKNKLVTVHFSNLTFINGRSDDFGGAISINTGNVYVDNCIFINNTASSDTNGGAISNYGTEQDKAYLFVNNSLFLGNHADHDGGAVTTHYANSDIYNSVFVNNSAHRDGGAIRVSIYGYGNVEDCIFIYNHADEWGGAYYSWGGTSNINRCIFLNNTAGTYGGAVMVSGNLSLTNSIIANNSANKMGGSFFIRNPMFDAITVINVNNNIITNNSSPSGQEIFILKWDYINHFFPDFNNNNWGNEDPNSPSIVDPKNISDMIHPTVVNHDYSLLYRLNFALLNRYYDILNKYYPKFSQDFKPTNNSNNRSILKLNNYTTNNPLNKITDNLNNKTNSHTINKQITANNARVPNSIEGIQKEKSTSNYAPSNDKRSVEVFKNNKKSEDITTSFDITYIIGLIIILLILLFGFLKRKNIFD